MGMICGRGNISYKMFKVLVLFLMIFSPKIDKYLDNLNHKNFKIREAASKELRRKLSWSTSIYLECNLPLELEARTRAIDAIKDYWHISHQKPDWPPIWALNPKKTDKFPTYYMCIKYLYESVNAHDIYENRETFATALFIKDLTSLKIPKFIINLIVAYMNNTDYTKEYINGRRK